MFLATSRQHFINTFTTPIQHFRNVLVTSIQHISNATTTPTQVFNCHTQKTLLLLQLCVDIIISTTLCGYGYIYILYVDVVAIQSGKV